MDFFIVKEPMSDNFIGMFWAFGTSILAAIQVVILSKPLKVLGHLAATILTNVVNFLILFTLGVITYETGQISLKGLFWFGLLGVLAYSFGRYVFYRALWELGPPRLTTIVSTAPFYGIILAILFLGEDPNYLLVIGTVLVVSGVVLVSYERTDKSFFQKGIAWAFLSAFLISLSIFIRKIGLESMPNPFLTVAWANFIGLLTLFGMKRFIDPDLYRWAGSKVIFLVLIAAVLNSISQFCMNYSVMYGDVRVVTPIITSSPIFSLLLTAIFLRRSERIRMTMVFGVFVTVFGMILIGFSQT